MVDGHNSMEMDKSPEGSGEDLQTIAEDKENSQQQTTNGSIPTTTISTIAVQSGETRLVIALLQIVIFGLMNELETIHVSVTLGRRMQFNSTAKVTFTPLVWNPFSLSLLYQGVPGLHLGYLRYLCHSRLIEQIQLLVR
ncbi:titin isoform X5 [Vespula squamosa]|uniref:Titin isoform X5 n=1 Tax=Vespula squamosa TaxID=30214 RepID=A0ABD2B9U0_VESSQ